MTLSGALALATLLAWTALLPSLWRTHPEAHRPAALAACGFAVAATLLLMLGPDVVPPHLPTVVKEGLEEVVHTAVGRPHPFVQAGWLEGTEPFRAKVWLRGFEATFGMALLFVLAATPRGLVAGAVMVLAWMASPWWVHAHLSDGPQGSFLWPTLVGASALAAIGASAPKTRWLGAAVVGLAAMTLTSMRYDMAAIGGPVFLAAIFEAASPPSAARLRARLQAAPLAGPLVLAIVGSSLGLYLVGAAAQSLDPLVATLHGGPPWSPRHFGSLRWHIDLLGFVPMGLAVLALAGMLRAPTLGATGLAGATGTLLLTRLHAAAGHFGDAPFETLRYQAAAYGAVGVLAIVGAATIAPRSKAWLLWGAVGVSALLPRPLARPGVQGAPWTLVRTQQQEGAWFLRDVIMEHGACTLVTRRARPIRHGQETGETWTHTFETAVFGGPLGPYRWVAGDEAIQAEATRLGRTLPDDLDDALAVGRAFGPCTRFVRGLDCNIAEADCDGYATGLDALDVRTVPVSPFNTHHATPPGDTATFGVYAPP